MSKSIFSVDRSNYSKREYIVHIIDHISPVYKNINPYGLTGAIIAFRKSVILFSAIALVFFSPSVVVNCSILGIDPMTNPFAIENLGGFFCCHVWLHSTETSGACRVSVMIFPGMGGQ